MFSAATPTFSLFSDAVDGYVSHSACRLNHYLDVTHWKPTCDTQNEFEGRRRLRFGAFPLLQTFYIYQRPRRRSIAVATSPYRDRFASQMLVLTGIFWAVAVSVMAYFFIQELQGLKKATRMKVRDRQKTTARHDTDCRETGIATSPREN